MKVINKTNFNILLNGYLLPPKSISIDFPESFKDHPDFVYNLGKRYIEIYNENKELNKENNNNSVESKNKEPNKDNSNQVELEKKEQILIEGEIGSVKNIEGVTFVVAGPTTSHDEIVLEKNDQIVKNNITAEDSLEVIDASLDPKAYLDNYQKNLTETDNLPESVNTKFADEEIEEDYSMIVKKNGRSAEVVNIKKEAEMALQKAQEQLKEAISLDESMISEGYKKYASKSNYQKRVFISKTTDKNLLNEIVNLEKSPTLKELARQRLQEL